MTQENKIQDKREDILDVAERLFAEQGFEAVSIREMPPTQINYSHWRMSILINFLKDVYSRISFSGKWP